MTQFIPTSYESYAADGDDDGKIDLYNSVPDAMASTARHLTERTRWTRGLPAAIEVRMPPHLLDRLAARSDQERWVKVSRSLSDWASLDVQRSDGGSLAAMGVPATTPMQALLTQGARGRVFLLSSNFEASMGYHKSTKYAIAVALLAQRVQEPADHAAGPSTGEADRPTPPAAGASAVPQKLSAWLAPPRLRPPCPLCT